MPSKTQYSAQPAETIKALIRSSEFLNNKQSPKLGRIYSRTAGVVFIGTPHRGSRIAAFAELVVSAPKVTQQEPNESLISNLKKNSDVLERQRKSFSSISKDMPIFCLHEEYETGLDVVNIWSISYVDHSNTMANFWIVDRA